jgi:hypothetical protein
LSLEVDTIAIPLRQGRNNSRHIDVVETLSTEAESSGAIEVYHTQINISLLIQEHSHASLLLSLGRREREIHAVSKKRVYLATSNERLAVKRGEIRKAGQVGIRGRESKGVRVTWGGDDVVLCLGEAPVSEVKGYGGTGGEVVVVGV